MARLSLDTNTPFKVCVAVLIAAIVAIVSFNVGASKRADVAWDEIKRGATIIDVRTAQEFNSGHLENAVNMPLSSLQVNASGLDRNHPVVVYCQTGSRAAHARRALFDMGFVEVYNGGGMSEMQLSNLARLD
ncbi:rhodanese-like domain-containing protein [Marinomonas ostreistagni]|uniref:rhodanese-like domain-containing protein n=1 Tax=Marinomonas ostreistagni TaxID=359209 RepID=UPI00194E76D7|nr:rhodanese-like domain-containing protein [Marinomonas ostreistagni]MBM6551433.1 rhodanese-like domain-containing protein [Marinomonas ostreistagni]